MAAYNKPTTRALLRLSYLTSEGALDDECHRWEGWIRYVQAVPDPEGVCRPARYPAQDDTWADVAYGFQAQRVQRAWAVLEGLKNLQFPVTAKRRNAVKTAFQKAIKHEEDIVDIAAKLSRFRRVRGEECVPTIWEILSGTFANDLLHPRNAAIHELEWGTTELFSDSETDYNPDGSDGTGGEMAGMDESDYQYHPIHASAPLPVVPPPVSPLPVAPSPGRQPAQVGSMGPPPRPPPRPTVEDAIDDDARPTHASRYPPPAASSRPCRKAAQQAPMVPLYPAPGTTDEDKTGLDLASDDDSADEYHPPAPAPPPPSPHPSRKPTEQGSMPPPLPQYPGVPADPPAVSGPVEPRKPSRSAPGNTGILPCPFAGCTTTAKGGGNLRRHFMRHAPPQFLCEVCGYKARIHRCLRGHSFREHGIPEYGPDMEKMVAEGSRRLEGMFRSAQGLQGDFYDRLWL